ncbi:MAG: AMP phosphorylase [Halobacteriota archaeon]
MELEAISIDIGTSRPLVLLNTADAEELGAHPLDRIHIEQGGRKTTAIVKRTEELVTQGFVGMTEPLHPVRGTVTVSLAGTPRSVRYVRKKLDDLELQFDEHETIVRDIHHDRLSDVELSAYVSAVYTNGLSLEETKHLTESMSNVGQRLTWNRHPIADKHSIGGVAGNCVTPIVVSVATEAGLTMPKTSSRAVTSPAGTADVMEVFCDVEFTVDEIAEIVRSTNGCLVWGGGVELSPVDDDLIRAENPLSFDPKGIMIASVLSKKRSVSSTHVVIDIPYGEGAKVEGLVEARALADDFERVGDHLDIDVACAITHGSDPVGRGIGPVLEARDVLAVLEGGGPEMFRLKSIELADMLLEHCGVDASAADIVDSGRALDRFKRILAAQNGDPDITTDDLEPGSETRTVYASRGGIVTRIDDRQLSDLARRAGAPRDSGAGIVIHRTNREAVESGDPLYTIHAEISEKLAEAEQEVEQTDPIRVRNKTDALVERR